MSESKKSVEDTLSSAIAQLEEEAALKKVSSVRERPATRGRERGGGKVDYGLHWNGAEKARR